MKVNSLGNFLQHSIQIWSNFIICSIYPFQKHLLSSALKIAPAGISFSNYLLFRDLVLSFLFSL